MREISGFVCDSYEAGKGFVVEDALIFSFCMDNVAEGDDDELSNDGGDAAWGGSNVDNDCGAAILGDRGVGDGVAAASGDEDDVGDDNDVDDEDVIDSCTFDLDFGTRLCSGARFSCFHRVFSSN